MGREDHLRALGGGHEREGYATELQRYQHQLGGRSREREGKEKLRCLPFWGGPFSLQCM